MVQIQATCDYMMNLGRRARAASGLIARATTAKKNQVLIAIADNLIKHREVLLAENQKDLENAKQNHLESALLDRLELNKSRIMSMAEGLQQIAALPDPVGNIIGMACRPSGIEVGQMRVPLGVIGIIYESRPNVTADAAGLCLKSGNACILRGGSEALQSNQAIEKCINMALTKANLPEEAVQVVAITDHAAVSDLLSMQDYIDVIIPRGGKGLIKTVNANARIPVIKHLDGICHVYIDKYADIEKATAIAFNAKTHRYGVCNAMESLLIAESVAEQILAELKPMLDNKGIEIRGCEKSVAMLNGIIPATEEDYATEYLAPIMSLKIVADIEEAIQHIAKYGSHHTDAIVTENYTHAKRFLREVDSSSVMVNASTRFADGFEYGLGAEIGISTDKFHARGPVGLNGLTSLKYIVHGSGQVRH